MAIRIGQNIASLGAQRRLGEATSLLTKSFERLSSGLRINSASDDAAGLAIASSLKAETRIFSQAMRNVNDGMSLLNIASAGLEQLTSIVTRVKELAEQSANGTFNHHQRKSLDDEAQTLSKEYLRIIRTTKFNGLNVLDGSMGPLNIQVGYGDSGIISAGMGGAVGDGTFEERVSYAVEGFAGASPQSIELKDFNGDGNSDLIAASDFDKTLSILFGNGDGSFKARTTVFASEDPYSLKAVDLNGDGILDLAMTANDENIMSIMIGNGDGSFRSTVSFPTGSRPLSLAFGDLNSDGKIDLITGDRGSESLSIFLGNGDGSFKVQTSIVYQSGESFNPVLGATGDVNGDDIVDIIYSGGPLFSRVYVSIGNGDGTFQVPESYRTLALGTMSTALADVNGDGSLDIAASAVIGCFVVNLGNGDGTFASSVSYAAGDSADGLAVADWNGDGFLDLASADADADSVSVVLGNGDGSFRAELSFSTGDNPNSIIGGDLNNDGVPDIITADLDSDTISVLLAKTHDGVSPLLPFSLLYQADALQALPVMDRALQNLSLQTSVIGALQSRMESAFATLGVSVENLTAARARIEDTDIAEESASLVRTLILQQAGAAVLAQANQAPALVLKLLSGP